MLALDAVAAAYGESVVLSEIALTVGSGEAVALLGRNGVGKTTLLRTVIGLHRLRAGRVSFEGNDVSAYAAHRRAHLGIAYVPQGRGIFAHLSVEENLRVGAGGPGARPLDQVLALFPALPRLLKRAGGVLSGGEQQQLALARALVAGPKLLLLDEPTEGIQPSVVAEIGEVLRRVRRELQVAFLLVEQHLDFAWALTERYYVMQRGRIVKEGLTAAEPPDAVGALLSV